MNQTIIYSVIQSVIHTIDKLFANVLSVLNFWPTVERDILDTILDPCF